MSRPAWVQKLQNDETEDPVVPVEVWVPEFHELHRRVVRETPDFDYAWLRNERPDLHKAIGAIRDEIDTLGPAPLSKVTELMSRWRLLMLEAEQARQTAGGGK